MFIDTEARGCYGEDQTELTRSTRKPTPSSKVLMIRFVCLPRSAQEGRRIMLSDQKLRQRADELRVQLAQNLQNTRESIQWSRELIAESYRRRESELAGCLACSNRQLRSSEIALTHL